MTANLDTAAPTGRNKAAQGKERRNAAPGHPSQNTPSPEWAKEGGELPTGWIHTTLGQLSGERGQTIEPAKTPEKRFELYSVPSFPEKKPEVVSGKEVGSNKQLVEPRSVLLCKINPRINRAWVVGDFTPHTKIASTEWITFPPTEDVVPDFLCFFLQQNAIRDFLAHNASGVGGSLMRVKPSTLRDFPFGYPSVTEQRRIVAEIEKQFTRLEAGVAALRRVQANLKRYRAAVLKAACEGRLVPTEAEWETTTLGDVSTVLAGYGFPERLQGRSTGDIGFFKVGDISGAWKRNEKILTQANHYISKADLAELRARVLPTGTVVFAKIGAAIALNRRAIIGEPSLVDNNVMGLHAGERIHPRFLFHFLCTQKLDELARATTVPSIRKGDVESIELKLPPLAEQTRIVAEVERRLSVVEELESVVSANLQRATRLRQSILQKAFTGGLTQNIQHA